jgi:hypothetical protein
MDFPDCMKAIDNLKCIGSIIMLIIKFNLMLPVKQLNMSWIKHVINK